MSTPLPVAPVVPAKAKSLEEIRGFFEKTIQESAKFRDNTPLGTMDVNGAFHHYIEPDTDTMWIGFALGYRIAERDHAAYLVAAANAYPALVEALQDCRDMLCAQSVRYGDGLAFKSQTKAIIQRAYDALQKAGIPAAQEGGK